MPWCGSCRCVAPSLATCAPCETPKNSLYTQRRWIPKPKPVFPPPAVTFLHLLWASQALRAQWLLLPWRQNGFTTSLWRMQSSAQTSLWFLSSSTHPEPARSPELEKNSQDQPILCTCRRRPWRLPIQTIMALVMGAYEQE